LLTNGFQGFALLRLDTKSTSSRCCIALHFHLLKMFKSATENDIRSILRESLVDPSPQSRELVSSTSVPIGMNAESIIGYASAGSTHLYKVMLLLVSDTLLPTEGYSFVKRSHGEDQRYVRALHYCRAVLTWRRLQHRCWNYGRTW
jgi:hypothetical protein